MTNNNVAGLDLPFLQLCNQAPIASQAIGAMTSQEDGTNQFMYYLTGSTFFRYDVKGDTWQRLANPYYAGSAVAELRYAGTRGFHGRVLSATSTTVKIGGLRSTTLHGKTIKLVQGVGDGQERVLTYVKDNIEDAGVITGTTANYLQDTTKKWKFNQWAGYTVACTFGANATQYKTVLYNDANTLYVYDANLHPQETWQNCPFLANAPYALPVITAGAQTHYQIMSQDFTVPAWTVVPDYATCFTVLTGGIFMVTSQAAPFFNLQYYDIAADRWQIKTVPQSILDVALGTEVGFERTGKFGSAFLTGTASSGSIRTLVDSSKTMEVDRYKNYRVRIVGGTGIGQNRRIVCNTATTFTTNRSWDVAPDVTSQYEVWGDYNRLYLTFGGRASMVGYDIENDYWMQGDSFDDGICANIAVKRSSGIPFGVSTGVRAVNGVLTVAFAPVAGGTGYSIGDILTLSTVGTTGKVIVDAIAPGGIVSAVSLIACGTNYNTGTSATTGGTGTGCTINVLTRGTVCRITTATSHLYRTGDIVTFTGCNSAGYNAAHTILGVDGLTTFDIATAEAANMAASNSQSVTVLVDASKNWTPGEFVGKLLHLMVAGSQPTSQVRWITANTQTTITVATIAAGINGTSKYAIYDAEAFGSDAMYKPADKANYGHATGGSTTTLIDSSKNWIPNCWVGHKFSVEAGTGFASGVIAITANTATTLTYATQTFTPDASTHYEIGDSFGLQTSGSTTTIVETGKKWIVNQWAGKRVRVLAGTGLGQEIAIVSNTVDTLTFAAVVATDATSVYTILGIPVSGAGSKLLWIWGNSDAATKGRMMFRPRGGGSNTADIFDIPTGRWNYGFFFTPQQELPGAGSHYAYDGANCIYFSVNIANLPIRIFRYDVRDNTVYAAFTTTWWEGVVTVGNLMEIIKPDGVNKFLYIMQHTGTLMSRAMIF